MKQIPGMRERAVMRACGFSTAAGKGTRLLPSETAFLPTDWAPADRRQHQVGPCGQAEASMPSQLEFISL